MAKRRLLNEVLQAMLKVIPDTEDSLRRELEGIEQNLGFVAPEEMGLRWGFVGATLDEHLGSPDGLDGWQKEVADIFMNRPSISVDTSEG